MRFNFSSYKFREKKREMKMQVANSEKNPSTLFACGTSSVFFFVVVVILRAGVQPLPGRFAYRLAPRSRSGASLFFPVPTPNRLVELKTILWTDSQIGFNSDQNNESVNRRIGKKNVLTPDAKPVRPEVVFLRRSFPPKLSAGVSSKEQKSFPSGPGRKFLRGSFPGGEKKVPSILTT